MGNYITEEKKSIEGHSDGSGGVRFTVFGKPVAKQRPRTVRGDRYGPKKVHTYTPLRTELQEEKIALVYRSYYGRFTFDKGIPLLMTIKYFLEIPKKTGKKEREKMVCGELRPVIKKNDVDNVCKLVMDALNGVAYADDSQIVELHGIKYWAEEPRTEIIIMPLGGADIEK